MGYSTTQIDKDKAINLARGKEVESASQEAYFRSSMWKRDVVRADIGDNNHLYFTLSNGDFVDIKLA